MSQTVNVQIDITTEGAPCELSPQEIADYWETVVRAACGPRELGNSAPQIVVHVKKTDLP